MWLSHIGHDAGSLVSQWDSSIKSPCVPTLTSRYPSWYDPTCCQDATLYQPTIPIHWQPPYTDTYTDMTREYQFVGPQSKAKIPLVHNANANDECECDNKRSCRISIESFHSCEYKCKLRQWQNELLHLVISPNVNVLSDGKFTHTQSRRILHAMQR